MNLFLLLNRKKYACHAAVSICLWAAHDKKLPRCTGATSCGVQNTFPNVRLMTNKPIGWLAILLRAGSGQWLFLRGRHGGLRRSVAALGHPQGTGLGYVQYQTTTTEIYTLSIHVEHTILRS